MANNKDLVIIGANGKGYVADVATTAPTGDPTSQALPAAFTAGDLGYLHTDGLEADVDEDRQEFQAWGSLGPIASQITKRTRTFVLSALETNAIVVGLYDGVAAPTPDATGLIEYSIVDNPDQDIRAWVFDTFNGGKWVRYYVPQGEITARENLTYKPDDMANYKFTVTAYPDSSGVSIYKWIKQPALAS